MKVGFGKLTGPLFGQRKADNASEARDRGDQARDRRDWFQAEGFYRQHVERFPDDWPLLIQLGHALKEQGKRGEAEAAYRRAIAVEPGDGDAHLQLGHVLKLGGDTAAALASYVRAFELAPFQYVRREIEGLCAGAGLAEPDYRTIALRLDPAVTTVITELDDMLTYFETHPTFSGIQRVQAEFVRYVHDPATRPDDGRRYIFVINPPLQGLLWQLDEERLMAVIRYAMSSEGDHDTLRALVKDCRTHSRAVVPGRGHFYLALGAFWNFNTVTARFLHIKEAGATLCGFIHDLIPINEPEYCDEPLCHEFALSFADCTFTFDCFMANSHYTAESVRAYFARHGLPERPVRVVQLAHASKAVSARDVRPAWTPKIAALKDKPFVMMVSTLEARKNHAFLVSVWRHFYNQGLNPPDLVFVGRQGWRVHDLMGMLKQSRNFGGRLHLLHDLSDEELNTLYAACLFTAFTSYVEGWGLPVGESLAHGRTCVASNAAAIPEIAGPLIDYVDPLNIREGIEVFARMTFDEAYRARRTAELQAGFRLRSWTDFSRDLVTAIGASVDAAHVPLPLAGLAPSRMFRPRDIAWGSDLPDDYAANPQRLMLARSWRPLESWGCWMFGNEAELRFRTGLPAGTPIVVYLEVKGSGHSSADLSVEARVGAGDAPAVLRLAERPAMMQARGSVGEEGAARVVLRAVKRPPFGNGEPALGQYLVGLHAFGYAPADDPDARIALAEGIVFARAEDAVP